ncbi:MAG: hypothetical protein HOE90_09905 [Bacteriovoracaceae bacterium]|nr:hypothetical protein [Bacteriovoracaceae bacterium]
MKRVFALYLLLGLLLTGCLKDRENPFSKDGVTVDENKCADGLKMEARLIFIQKIDHPSQTEIISVDDSFTLDYYQAQIFDEGVPIETLTTYSAASTNKTYIETYKSSLEVTRESDVFEYSFFTFAEDGGNIEFHVKNYEKAVISELAEQGFTVCRAGGSSYKIEYDALRAEIIHDKQVNIEYIFSEDVPAL